MNNTDFIDNETLNGSVYTQRPTNLDSSANNTGVEFSVHYPVPPIDVELTAPSPSKEKTNTKLADSIHINISTASPASPTTPYTLDTIKDQVSCAVSPIPASFTYSRQAYYNFSRNGDPIWSANELASLLSLDPQTNTTPFLQLITPDQVSLSTFVRLTTPLFRPSYQDYLSTNPTTPLTRDQFFADATAKAITNLKTILSVLTPTKDTIPSLAFHLSSPDNQTRVSNLYSRYPLAKDKFYPFSIQEIHRIFSETINTSPITPTTKYDLIFDISTYADTRVFSVEDLLFRFPPSRFCIVLLPRLTPQALLSPTPTIITEDDEEDIHIDALSPEDLPTDIYYTAPATRLATILRNNNYSVTVPPTPQLATFYTSNLPYIVSTSISSATTKPITIAPKTVSTIATPKPQQTKTHFTPLSSK